MIVSSNDGGSFRVPLNHAKQQIIIKNFHFIHIHLPMLDQ